MQIETWQCSDGKIKYRISGNVGEILGWIMGSIFVAMGIGFFIGSL